MTHDDLVDRAAAWLKGRKCAVVAVRKCIMTWENPDAIGWKPSGTSILIECKTSRSDFLRDLKKRSRRFPSGGMGSLRYYLAPAGLLKREDMPKGWGLLEATARGIRVVVKAEHRPERNWLDEIRQLVHHGKGYMWTRKEGRIVREVPVPVPDLNQRANCLWDNDVG